MGSFGYERSSDCSLHGICKPDFRITGFALGVGLNEGGESSCFRLERFRVPVVNY